MNEVYIFAHIPKTAGTTLRYHFQKHLQDQIEFIHMANKGIKNAKVAGLLPFEDRSTKERLKAKVILGHNVNKHTKNLVCENKVIELVYFRDPKTWEISRYNQYANAKSLRNQSFLNYPDWICSEQTRSQFDWFLMHYGLHQHVPTDTIQRYELLVDTLKPFQHVGFVDHINHDMVDVSTQLGIPTQMTAENVTGKFKKKDIFSLNNENLRLLSGNCTEEIELFLKIRKKFDRNVK